MSTLFVFVHGWKGSENSLFIPLLRTKLGELGFPSAAQSYPNPEDPVYTEWKAAFLRQIQDEWKPDQRIVIIGHSLGGYFVQRVLGEDFDQAWAQAIVGAVIVSGVSLPTPGSTFEGVEINWENIKKLNLRFVSLYSADDELVTRDNFDEAVKQLEGYKGLEAQLVNGFAHFQLKEAKPITDAVLSFTK
jgi:predicted alpha/beta hydrolase family esterase